MDNVTVRPATFDDAEALADLLLALGFFLDLEPLTKAERLKLLGEKLELVQAPSHTLLVAATGNIVTGGPIVGYAAVHWLPALFQFGLDGYLSELFVTPVKRGGKVGTRLLHAVYDEGKRRGATRLTLFNLRRRESYLRGFYTKQGWTEQAGAARFVYDLTSHDLSE